MANFSSSDEEGGYIEESEYEENPDENTLLRATVIEDEQYNDFYFSDLDLKRFRQNMIPKTMGFLDVAIAHIQATLSAKGENIASGLFPLEINQVIGDLSGKWMNLDFLATNIFTGDEAMKRNSVNMLHHDWFSNYVEQTDSGRYRIKETDENREVLEMMKEGANYAAAKKQFDNANRNMENERPENRARYMHGCNFLSCIIKIACDIECLDEVEWQAVQKVYSQMATLYENRGLHSCRYSDEEQEKFDLFKVYKNVLNLEEHNSLNGTLVKHITGRRRAKDALCEPLFANIGMQQTNDSGGFTVYIKDSNKEYSKDDIERIRTSNMRPMTVRETQMSKKEEERIRKEQERDERKATYTPKFASRHIAVIPEIQSTSKPKPTPYGKTGWDGANDDAEDDDSEPSTSGLAPQLAKRISHEGPKRIAKAVKLEPKEDKSEASDNDFSSVGEMDADKDNLYSDADDEGDPVRRKKKVLKTSSVAAEPKANSVSKESGSNEQNKPFPTAANHTPFGYSDEEEEEVDDSEPEEQQDDNESVVISEAVEPILINDGEMLVTEEVTEDSNFESHGNVSDDFDMLIDRNIPDQLDIATNGSVEHLNTHPKVPQEMHQDYKAQKKIMEKRVAHQAREKYEEDEDMFKHELQIKKQREKERIMKEFAEEEKIRKLAQEKVDEEVARKLQQQLDSIAVQNGRNLMETSQRNEGYNGRKAVWSDLGFGKQEYSGSAHRRELQPDAGYSENEMRYRNVRESQRNADLGQLRENGRNTMFAAGAQSSYPASLTDSAFSSVSQNFGRRPGNYDSPYDNGPPRTCAITRPINSRIIADLPVAQGPTFRQDHDAYRGVLRDERVMNQNYGSHGHSVPIRDRDVEYRDGRYSNLPPPRIGVYDCYKAIPASRYDVPLPRASNSFNRPNIDNNLMRVNHGSAYPTRQHSNNLNPQGDAFIKFIKFYMIMFARPATEIQWSEIVERCKKINATFRYQHPMNIFGPSYVDQLLRRLPEYIQVFSLEGSNEVIFALDECKYGGFNSLGDSRIVFVEFVHSFLLAFNSSAIKWFSIAENNSLFPCPDTVFRTPMGGNWMDEFTELAQRMGLPLKAQKPCSEIYLHISQS